MGAYFCQSGAHLSLCVPLSTTSHYPPTTPLVHAHVCVRTLLHAFLREVSVRVLCRGDRRVDRVAPNTRCPTGGYV